MRTNYIHIVNLKLSVKFCVWGCCGPWREVPGVESAHARPQQQWWTMMLNHRAPLGAGTAAMCPKSTAIPRDCGRHVLYTIAMPSLFTRMGWRRPLLFLNALHLPDERELPWMPVLFYTLLHEGPLPRWHWHTLPWPRTLPWPLSKASWW